MSVATLTFLALMRAIVCVLFAIHAASAAAQTSPGEVAYERSYFERFSPATALDMIRNTPGFVLDEGANVRGFAAAAGNVLIDGERPPSKTRTLTESLSQIPAERVARIEIRRGGDDASLSEQTVIANVVLLSGKGGTSAPYSLKGAYDGRFSYDADLALSRDANGADISVGLKRSDVRGKSSGPEIVRSFVGADERRDERQLFDARATTLNAEVELDAFLSGHLQLTGQGRWGAERGSENSLRQPEGATPFLVLREEGAPFRSFEVGSDYSRALGDQVELSLISVINRQRTHTTSLNAVPSLGRSQRAITTERRGESIVRGELEWRRRGDQVSIGVEGARTFIDNEFAFFEDLGNGEVPVASPGANSRVNERRLDAFVAQSRRLSPQLTMEARLGFETSTISQTGDVENSRSFTFLKPRFDLTYSPSDQRQIRLRIERQVGQLDFGDFISSNDFDDDEFEFGNPELRPDRRWRYLFEIEQRFGDGGVVELGAFHERISDVQDLLPIGESAEVPGNIGDGTVFAVTLKGALPLNAIRISNAA